MLRLRDFVPFFFLLRTFVIKATILVFGLFTIFWISGGIYGSFYYAYMPQQTYLLPVDFVFDPCPMDLDKDRCSFLKATVDFRLDKMPLGRENYLIVGQTYSISLELELPSDDTNRNVGMFISCITLESISGETIKSDVCKSSVLPYRTDLQRNLWSIIPFSNSGAGEESLSIEFFNSFQDDINAPVSKAQLQIQSRYLGISKALLRIHSHFRGLRFLMYHYPIASCVVGMMFISIFLFSMLFLVLGIMLDPVQTSDHHKTRPTGSNQVPQRLGNCPSFGKLAQKVNCEKVQLVVSNPNEEEIFESHGDDDASNSSGRQRVAFNLHED